MYRMLKLVNIAGMEEIELYLEMVLGKPQVNQSVGTYTYFLLEGNDNVEELNYGCGPNSALVVVPGRFEVYGDDEDCEDEEGDGESDGDVQVDSHVSSFLTLHQLMENEQGSYVSINVAGCDVSNNLDPEDPKVTPYSILLSTITSV